MLAFDEAYEVWFQKHLSESTGERRRILEEQREKLQQDGEDSPVKLLLRNVWWPLFGNLDYLYPEYEVVDFLGRTRFLDIAYRPLPLLYNLEVDGYGPHLKDISRRGFSDERRRDSCLEILGWNIIRFSFDDVKLNARDCQHILQHWLGRWKNVSGKERLVTSLSILEREIVKFALSTNSVVSLSDVTMLGNVCDKTARKLMRVLVGKGVFRPLIENRKRIHLYKLIVSESIKGLF